MTPSIKLNSAETKTIQNLVSKWLSKMNFGNGALHFEAKYDPLKRQLMPIEINPRLGGSETWSNIKACCGVDLIRAHLNVCLDFELSQYNDPTCRCISRNFLAKNTVLEAIKVNFERVKQERDLIEFIIFKTIGTLCTIDENIGWINVKSEIETSETHLISKLNDIVDNFRFEFNKSLILEN